MNVIQDWLAEQWNRPSRSDHYVMQLTNVVANLLAREYKSHDLRITFGRGDDGETRRRKSVDDSFPPVADWSRDEMDKVLWAGALASASGARADMIERRTITRSERLRQMAENP